MGDYPKQCYFTELVLLAIQGEITAEQMKLLDHIFKTDPSKIREYIELLEVHTELSPMGSVDIISASSKTDYYNDYLHLLENYEKVAPSVEIPEEKPKRELIRKVVYPAQKKYTMSSFYRFALSMSVAAMLFIAFLVKFAPDNRSNIQVATLADQMNVQWAESSQSLKINDCLYSNEPFIISKGLIKIQTNRGVLLTFEGPAAFEFSKEGGLSLDHGRVYAQVGSQGIGFTVVTSNSKIIDLGTEFGVTANRDGSTELHVFKGKTTLVSGSSWLDKKTMTIQQNEARQLSSDGTQIRIIPIQEEVYARTINSKTKTVWRGFQADLALFDNMDTLSDEIISNRTPNGTLGGQWDIFTNNPQGGGVQKDSESGNRYLNVISHSGGDGRGSAFNGLSDPINEGQRGVLFFRFNVTSSRENPVGMYMGFHTQTSDRLFDTAQKIDQIVAGFAAFGITQSATAPYSITTIDRVRVLKSDLKRDVWYNAWIVANNGKDTFDLYISQAASPVGNPGMPTEHDLIGSDIPFYRPTTDPLVGGMFWGSQKAAGLSDLQTPWVSIDEIWWGRCRSL